MRDNKASKRDIDPDKIYNNKLVAKFINRLMNDGKKLLLRILSIAHSILLKVKKKIH